MAEKRLCSLEGCDKKHYAKNYCTKHYSRFKKHGNPLIQNRFYSDGFCTIDGCNKKHSSKGYCDKHLWKYNKYGDPLKGRTYNISGKSSSRTYSAWKNMIQRCLNPNNEYYHRYGGRGIKICKKWIENFNEFFSDMGECPPSLTLERLDTNGNYEPSNCIWDTMLNQSINRNVRYDNKLGVIGVSETKYGTYVVRIKDLHIKTFKDLKSAIRSRLKAEIEYFGELKQKHLAHYLDDSKK